LGYPSFNVVFSEWDICLFLILSASSPKISPSLFGLSAAFSQYHHSELKTKKGTILLHLIARRPSLFFIYTQPRKLDASANFLIPTI
jgi:hypothetical protein